MVGVVLPGVLARRARGRWAMGTGSSGHPEPFHDFFSSSLLSVMSAPRHKPGAGDVPVPSVIAQPAARLLRYRIIPARRERRFPQTRGWRRRNPVSANKPLGSGRRQEGGAEASFRLGLFVRTSLSTPRTGSGLRPAQDSGVSVCVRRRVARGAPLREPPLTSLGVVHRKGQLPCKLYTCRSESTLHVWATVCNKLVFLFFFFFQEGGTILKGYRRRIPPAISRDASVDTDVHWP